MSAIGFADLPRANEIRMDAIVHRMHRSRLAVAARRRRRRGAGAAARRA